MYKFQLLTVAFGTSSIAVPFKTKINYFFISVFIGMLSNHLPVYRFIKSVHLYHLRPLC